MPHRLLRLQRLLPLWMLQSRSRLPDHRVLCGSVLDYGHCNERCHCCCTFRSYCGVEWCCTEWIMSECVVQLSCQSGRKLLSERICVWRAVHSNCFGALECRGKGCAQYSILCAAVDSVGDGDGCSGDWCCDGRPLNKRKIRFTIDAYDGRYAQRSFERIISLSSADVSPIHIFLLASHRMIA